MQPVKTVGIVSKPDVPEAAGIVSELLRFLDERGITIRCDESTAAYAGRTDGLPRSEVPDGCQFVIVLGGDGTLLAAARAIGDRGIPLFAVNLGTLGFLTAITVNELYPELERALRRQHRVGHRRMLRCEVLRGGEVVGSYAALNDVVVTKTAVSRMIELDIHVGHHFVCSYRADGVIVCTPTGSTAYSLSAGGPIVFPTVAAFCITPISPHMLTNRPVIVPDSSVIQIVNRAPDAMAFLNVDGQAELPLKREDRILCRASKHTLELIRPPRLLYFDVLRQKLKWGER
jgi:NAD+ kinase